MKLKKSADPIGITAEHLIYGGHHLKLWLLQVINVMVDLETIPECINLATVTPVYKGSGKDPLDRGSYRGISVTSVIAKLLELLILMKFEPYLLLSSCQSVWILQKNLCADVIFSTAELISHYLKESQNIYLCCYDLQKVRDSVEC